MDAFWFAVLSTIVLGLFVKSIVRHTIRRTRRRPPRAYNVIPHQALAELDDIDEEAMEQRQKAGEAKAQEEQYRKDLRRQGYTDDVITMILPQVMNDGK